MPDSAERPDVAPLITERYQLDDTTTDRGVFLAALRAMIIFFEANPELPIPAHGQWVAHVDSNAEVERIAALIGIKPYGPADARQFHMRINPGSTPLTTLYIVKTQVSA